MHLLYSKKFLLLITIMLFCLFFISFVFLLKPLTVSSWQDFSVYYSSAKTMFSSDMSLHNYLYPPISLVVFFPFVLFPYVTAGKIWTIVSLMSLLISLWTFLKLYNEHKNIYVILIAGILVSNFFPVKFTLGMGQINIIILLILTIAYSAIVQNKSRLCGVLFGVSLTLKYFPLFIPIYFIVRKKWTLLLVLLMTVLSLFGIGVVFFTPAVSIHFVEQTLPVLTSSLKTDYYNQALSGFLLRTFSLSSLEYNIVRIFVSILMIICTVWVIAKKQFDKKFQLLEVSTFITLSLLLNTFSWQHHFVLLLLPLGVTYFLLKKLQVSWGYFLILICSYLLVAMNAKSPQDLPVIFQSHVFWGALLLWVFDLYLLYKFCPNKSSK